MNVGDEMVHHYETTSGGVRFVAHIRVRIVKINPRTVRVERIQSGRDGGPLQRNVQRKNLTPSLEACRSGICAEYDLSLPRDLGWAARKRPTPTETVDTLIQQRPPLGDTK